MPNYVPYHVHSDYSLLDSCTKFEDYVSLAKENGMTALGSSEHGLPRGNVHKKLLCDEAGIKFLYGVECYLTASLQEKVRDNYHTVLIARNENGAREIRRLMIMASDAEHMYYNPRLSFDEFLRISRNVIKISACIASPLSKLPISDPWYYKLAKHYDYLEIQHHDCEEQAQYNQWLYQLSLEIGKPLIAGTDTHSSSPYKEACRKILMKSKRKSFLDEDKFDLVFKTYDELVEAYRTQGALPMEVCLQAIENTNVMADSVEDYKLDTRTKYPISYGSEEEDARMYAERVERMFREKLDAGIIPESEREGFRAAIDDEMRIFNKLGMCGFMLSMSELMSWCRENGYAIGFARGSVGGSRVAYVTDIIDMDPEKWNTVFSRFCNEDRVETGDVDVDCISTDRPKIFEHIIERFGEDKTARVASYGTVDIKGAIDDIGRALKFRWIDVNDPKHAKDYKVDEAEIPNCPYTLKKIDKVKKLYEESPEQAKDAMPELFYYLDGVTGTRISQSVHPAGMIISPVSLGEEFGVFIKDGEKCLLLDMDEAHDVGLVKYDLLVLKTVQVIRDACTNIGCAYPRSYQIDWSDAKVWEDMLRSPTGVFQMESAFAFQSLKKYKPVSIQDMSLITACLRPSGASYRDAVFEHRKNINPTRQMDELWSDTLGYCVYQEQIIKALMELCGFSGGQADTVRRDIAKKKPEKIAKDIIDIKNGYAEKHPNLTREESDSECSQFVQVISDASGYSFGYNHSTGYCLLGYLCAYYRYYYPLEFITSFLNNAANDDDISNGTALAELYGIKVSSPKYGSSRAVYSMNKETNTITKGLESVKFMNANVADQLYTLSVEHPEIKSFMELLKHMAGLSINSKQLGILIDLDFFSDFGNSNQLHIILDYFDLLKEGTATKISKEKLSDDSLEFIGEYATDVGKSGNVLKSYTITDMDGLLARCEAEVMADKRIVDKSFTEKCAIQNEYLGYVDIKTGKPEDRRRLWVTNVIQLKSKNDNRVWAHALKVRSVGTGKAADLTVRHWRFEMDPIVVNDIIYASEIHKERGQYWYLDEYHVEMN